MMLIISLLIIILTLSIIKDTHVKVYYTKYSNEVHLVEEYDIKLPLWVAILIILFGMVPGLNIALFILFITTYSVHVLWSPTDRKFEYTHKFILRNRNCITRFISRIFIFIKKILTIEI